MEPDPIPDEPMEWGAERRSYAEYAAHATIALCLLAILILIHYYLAGGAK